MGVGDETFAAIADPFDRAADAHGGPGDDGLLGVVKLLHAEAAADVGRHHPQLVLRNVEHEVAHQQLDDVRKLAGGVERVLAARAVVIADGGARLHRVTDQTVVDQTQASDVRRFCERSVGGVLVADLPVDTHVVGDVVEHRGRSRLQRVEHADHGRQDIVFDRHGLGGIARLGQGFGDDERDGITDVTDLALGQRRMRRLLGCRTALAHHRPGARQTADAGGLEVFTGEHVDHAGHRQSSRLVDRDDMRMGVRRADEHRGGHVRQLDVGDVIAAPHQEAHVFLALHRGADTGGVVQGDGNAGRMVHGVRLPW